MGQMEKSGHNAQKSCESQYPWHALASNVAVFTALAGVVVGVACGGDKATADNAKVNASAAQASVATPIVSSAAQVASVSAPVTSVIASAKSSASGALARVTASSSAFGDLFHGIGDVYGKPFGSGGLGLRGTGEGGGCPCGCDHSEEMVLELRQKAKEEAKQAIDDSLFTISEREDAGYITERMVQHRMRLLSLGREIGYSAKPKNLVWSGFGNGFHAKLSEGPSVGGQLLVFGETTEIVHGKVKPLRASFVLRMKIENSGARAVVPKPELASKVGMPISRWYVVGGDNQPWDGVIEGNDKKMVYAIGYLDEPLPPGADMRVELTMGAYKWQTNVVAKNTWNQRD